MAKYQKYAEYKDSGVNELDVIPLHWDLSKVKYLASYLNGYAFKPDHWAEFGVPIIRIQNLSNHNAEINRTEFCPLERYKVKAGDILISWSATLDVYIWNREDAWLNQHIFKVSINKKYIDSQFFYWTAKWFMGELNESSHGSTMQHLTADKFGSFNVPLPKIGEQKQIANFLDHETAKIDSLIAKQEKLIELLKEKRQAVISHAVTKGLNPDVNMKDSGVEWLGQVPEHWRITPLKYQVETINGFGFSSNDFCDEGVPFIRAGNIKKKSITNVEIFLPQKVVNKYKRVILSSGDVVISMVGSDPTIKESAVGQVGIIPTDYEGAVPNQNIVILREKGCNLLKKYLFYSLCSTAYRTHLDIFSHKLANQAIISSSLIISAKFIMPSLEEQLEIISYLDKQLVMFDEMMLKAESAIQLMQERRTALISSAVTGKIDVRNWQYPNEAKTELSL